MDDLKQKRSSLADNSIRLGNWSWFLFVASFVMAVICPAVKDPFLDIAGLAICFFTLLLSLLSFVLAFGCLFAKEKGSSLKKNGLRILFSSPLLLILVFFLFIMFTKK